MTVVVNEMDVVGAPTGDQRPEQRAETGVHTSAGRIAAESERWARLRAERAERLKAY